MIHIIDKKNCCGCSACVQRCPKQCIRLEEDEEGFLYPNVNETTCIKCGLCEKVCPILNQADKRLVQEVLAVKNPNDEERMNSSSGGIFIALAQYFIKNGGVVFGAVYDVCWEVHHVYTETIEGVYPMMGSKYLQSRIENTYKEAELFLKQGRKVLFIGTPCQIAGLRGFLRHKDYSNLLAIDFVCHGVPSTGVWRRYLAETYSGYNAKEQSRRQATAGKNSVLLSSLNAKSPIGDIKFRDKAESGWKKSRFVVRKESALKADQNSVLSSDIHYQNPFMRGFLQNLYLRPSCYDCRCKNGVSHSDLTIGDYWAARVTDKDFDDDKGCGLLLINTDKGKNFWEKLNFITRKSDIETGRLCNPGLDSQAYENPQRMQFYRMFNRGITVNDAVARCLRTSLKVRAKKKLKHIIKRLLGVTN